MLLVLIRKRINVIIWGGIVIIVILATINKKINTLDLELAKLLFPSGILDYFDVKSYQDKTEKIHFHLEEKNILPKEYESERAVSKGFLDEIIIEDFPLRGKMVLLHVRRRRWTLKESGKIVKRDWELTAKGMKMTAEFADFLKGIR